MKKLFVLFVLLSGFSFTLDFSEYVKKNLRRSNIVEIPEGVYYLNKPLRITKSGVRLRGIGKVVIVSEIKGKGKAVIEIYGKRGKLLGYVEEAKSGGNVIRGTFNVPKGNVRYVWVYAENTPNFVFNELKSKVWFKDRPYLIQGIYRVKKIYEDKIILKDKLDISFPENSKVYVVKPVENVIIENITFVQDIPEQIDYDFIKYNYENLFPSYAVDTIHIKWGANIHLRNITVKLSGRHPINLEYDYGIKIENLKVFGSLNKGKGGNGYVRFSKTHKSILENCYIEGIRHLTFQWASSRNVVRNCIIKVDVNFHGGYERFNKVIDSRIIIPKEHPWAPVEKTPLNAHWAPPSGPGNEVKNTLIKIE